jgi:drug/metabolite transporter (DMT)-like permease
MFIALLSALAATGNILLDKFALSTRKVALKEHLPLSFGFLFLLTFISLPWLGGVEQTLLGNRMYMFYIILMVLLAIMWNIFYYQGLQRERMVEFEMIVLTLPLVTVVMAAVFFPEEFRWPVFAASLVGGITLLVSHLRKRHLEFDKYAIHLLLAVVLMAMESMVINELLQVFSPATLYAIRTAMLAVFFTIYYRPKVHSIPNFDYTLILASSAFGAFSMVAKFYGYQILGITYTTLMLLLVPVLVTWFDAKVNKQPIRRRTLVAFVVIMICVVYAATYTTVAI